MPGQYEVVTRLFVAVWPSDEARAHVRALPRDGWVDVRWTPEDNWHVTLAFLGEADVDDVMRRLSRGEYHAATAVLAPRMRTMGRESLVVPVDGLDQVAAAVRTHVFANAQRQPFRGHLTVGRSVGKRPIVSTTRSGQIVAPLAFEVTEIALVRSVLSAAGARYDTVGTVACR